MDYYYLTGKFTLIPNMFFTQQNAVEAMKELFGVEKGEIIKHSPIQLFNAYMVYSLPIEIVSKMKEGENIYPFAFCLIDFLKNIKEYNKVIFHYSSSHNLAHVVICKGNELQLVNSYSANSFESAVYFLFLALKQTIINPLQTKIQMCSEFSPQEVQTIEKYFSGVEINCIDAKINLL